MPLSKQITAVYDENKNNEQPPGNEAKTKEYLTPLTKQIDPVISIFEACEVK
jgi:hypothetical protein